MKTRAVVMFSGGVGSWAAAKRAVERFGAENVTLLFADTMMEDEDLYRFLDEAVVDVGAEFVRIADGRTPWELFRDEKYIGNTRVDICSRVLKRDLMRDWVVTNRDPDDTVIVMGIDWTELHRFEKAEPRWLPWELWAPMCEEPLIDKADVRLSLSEAGIAEPRLYAMGFPHNNCGGFCVKAGMSQFKLLLDVMPDRYREHEEAEEAFRRAVGKDVSILRDRSKALIQAYFDHLNDDDVDGWFTAKEREAIAAKRLATLAVPLTLRRFRERIEASQPVPDDEWGGCGCALD